MIQILWSGGVESTSLLKHFLESTNEQVLAHFIRIEGPITRKTEAEERVIRERLTSKLTRIRPFEFTMSWIRVDQGMTMPFDFEVLYPFALFVHRRRSCTASYRAHNFEDGHGLTPQEFHAVRSKTAIGMLRAGETLESVFPFHESYLWTKRQHWENLGDLAELTITCHFPSDDLSPCGKCLKCQERAALV